MCDQIISNGRNEKKLIDKFENLILRQKIEILKTEELITIFTNHRAKQNKALKIFYEEQESIRREILEKILQNKRLQKNKPHEKECIKRIEVSLEGIFKPLKRVASRKITKKVPVNMIKLSVKGVENRKVYGLLKEGNDIFICGSKGMLLKQSGKDFVSYKTNTEEDILQVQIINNKDKISLVAFTNDCVLIYKNINKSEIYRVVHLRGIGCVSSDEEYVYIPIKDGIIKTLNKENLIILPFIKGLQYSIKSVAADLSECSFNLFNSTEGLLYKMKKKGTRKVEVVPMFSNIRHVSSIITKYFFCYTDDTFWTLNLNLEVQGNMKVKSGIKKVATFKQIMAVVDHENGLFVYDVSERFSELLCRRAISGTVTALTVSEYKVYLWLGDHILIVDFEK